MTGKAKLALGNCLFILMILSAPTVRAQSNTVNIETNTGGNSGSGSIQTGDTSTSVRIENNAPGSTNRVETDSQSSVSIQSSGGGTNSVSIDQNGTKIELNQQNGQTTLKTTDPQGNVEERNLEGDSISVELSGGTLTISPSGETISLQSQNTTATTSLPLEINPDRTVVSFITSQGPQTLDLLPDEIISRALTRHRLETIDADLELTDHNGNLAFNLQGTQSKRLLGLIQVKINKQIKLSAQSGDLLDEHLATTKDKIFDLLSI